MDNKSSKIDWMKILQVVAQAIIAALTPDQQNLPYLFSEQQIL